MIHSLESLKRTRRVSHWSLSSLEQRLLLVADAGAAVQSPNVAAEVAIVDISPASATQAAQSTSGTLVFVDPSAPDLDTLIEGIDSDAELVLLNKSESGIDQITRVLTSRRSVQSVHLIGHGRAGEIELGGSVLNEANLVSAQEQIREWSRSMTDTADILVYGCHTGAGDAGAKLVRRLANLTGADVAASTDATGNRRFGGDWILERSVGDIESMLVVNVATQQTYAGVLPISIRAAGVTNEEQMLLQINGSTVATYDNVGGDAYGGQFQTYTYNADGVSADDVRIVFTNDLYDEAAGIDRNLRVDSVTIDGQVYETEAPDVFSTGTWQPADGITPGFRESEFLHTDGYLQFADNSSNQGSLIQVVAAGDTGQETMELEIDGTVVQTWQNVSTTESTFAYQASGTISADQVRINFTNDVYDSANNIDRNLDVNRIVIDGSTYETEATSVYSTGTWRPEDGISPGFRQSETLHGNGYFQYASDVQIDAGAINLSVDSLTIGEDTGTLNIILFREGGSDGTVTVDYTTSNGSADGSDYESIAGTVTFADGITSAQLSLTINDDDLVESDETFTISLSNPTGGATLGAATAQFVTISDNDEVVTGVIYEDSFEGAANWTTNPFGTDTATTGQWAVGSPQQTTSGGIVLQQGSGHTGTRALVTGLAAGSSVGSFDIDSGPTSVISGEIDLPSGAELELTFEYYFSYLDNASNDDYFAASIVSNGQTTEIFDDHAHSSNTASAWQEVTIDVSQYAGQTVQLLFEAADALGGSLVEAAVDDIVIEALPITPGTVNIATTGVNVDEASGIATVTVRRTSGRNGSVSVDYTTADGTADSFDYTAASGTLTFADGQAEQTITIDITDDATEEDLESFTLTISNATGGAVLGTDTTATITIADNDSTTPDYLPDMVPIAATLLEQLSIDTSEIPGRELLRFSTEVANGGDGPLEIWGGTASGNSQQVFQRIYQADGGYRDRLAGEFVYHPGHGHIHFEGFATYDLKLTDASGNIVASGGKTSFCLINIRNPLPGVTDDAGLVHGRGGNNCGNVQGISTGYSDVYSASLDDQWIDVTDVPDGSYWLEITTDPDNNIQETDETNNTERVLVTLSNGQVTGV